MRLPNGYGGVVKLSGNRRRPYAARITTGWHINDITGKRIQHYQILGYAPTRSEALQILARYNNYPIDGETLKLTFREIYLRWSEEKFPTISHSNIKGYRAAYATCENIADMPFHNLRLNDLQQVIDHCGKNYPTLKKIRVLFNQLYSYAMKHEIVSKDYSAYVNISKYKDRNPNKNIRSCFSTSEIALLWKHKNDPYCQTVLMLIYNGVRVSELSYTFTINTNGNGYTSGSNLYLNKAGDTAVAEISYKSGKYDKDGKPVDNIAAQKVTITAVDQSAVSEFAVKIDKSGKSFDKAKDSNKIAVEDTDYVTAYFKIKDADGKEVSDSVYNKYTVESSDKSVLMLANNTITVDSNKTRSIALKGVKVGTAYLLFKDRDNKIVGSVAIDVVAKREVASITLDKNYLTISNKANTTRTVKATLKDQYGNDWDLTRNGGSIAVTYKDSSNGKTLTRATASGKDITVNALNAGIGTYNYYVQYINKDGKNTVSQVLTIVVATPTTTGVDTYRVDFNNATVDTTVKEGNLDTSATTDNKNITANLYGVSGGVDDELVSSTYNSGKKVTYTVKKADGTVIFGYTGNATNPATDTSATVKTNAAINVDNQTVSSSTDLADVQGYTLNISVVSGGACKTKNLDAGSYTVIARYDGKIYTSNFVVTDSQGKASVEFTPEFTASNVLKLSDGNGSVKNALVNAIKEVNYNGNKLSGSALYNAIRKVEGTINNVAGVNGDITTATLSGQQNFTVTKLVVEIAVPDTSVTTNVEVDLPNTVITIQ